MNFPTQNKFESLLNLFHIHNKPILKKKFNEKKKEEKRKKREFLIFSKTNIDFKLFFVRILINIIYMQSMLFGQNQRD